MLLVTCTYTILSRASAPVTASIYTAWIRAITGDAWPRECGTCTILFQRKRTISGQKLQLIDTYPPNLYPKVYWEFENVGFDEKKSLDIQIFITPAEPAERAMIQKNIFLWEIKTEVEYYRQSRANNTYLNGHKLFFAEKRSKKHWNS